MNSNQLSFLPKSYFYLDRKLERSALTVQDFIFVSFVVKNDKQMDKPR